MRGQNTPFVKGHKFGKGRPKGIPNKRTEQWLTFSGWFMDKALERLPREMSKLSPVQYVNTVAQLLEYFKPKLSRAELTNNVTFTHLESLEQALRTYVTTKQGTNGLGQARLPDVLQKQGGQPVGNNGRSGATVLLSLPPPPSA